MRIDVSNIVFIEPKPSPTEFQSTLNVTCGITIQDKLSGVNASSIEFSTSTTGIWGYGDWQSANKINNNNHINCSVTPTFKEGTENYIRWRAKDVAGNGYHVSDNYQIKIKENHPPNTTLISPMNNSVVYTLTPELIYSGLDPDNDVNLTYKIYLNSDKYKVISLNNSAIIKSNINTTRYKLEVPLIDGQTYYWTVISNDGFLSGSCISGFWKFFVDTTIDIPYVTLLEPVNNTNVTTTTPKISWAPGYFNLDIVTFNIYLARSPLTGELVSNKNLVQEDYKLTTYIFDKLLVRGEKYYWTIIPIANHPAGRIEGLCRSGIWSFKVKLPEVHIYNLSMELESESLSVEQGGYITTNITITNLGDIEDTIAIDIDEGILNANIAFKDSTNKITLLSNEHKILTLEIMVSPIATPKNYTIFITASSENAPEGQEVSVTKTIQLEVQEKELEDQGEEPKQEFGVWDLIMWLIIILTIFILITISIFYYNAKKARKIPTVRAELMYKVPPHLALPEGETKAEEEQLLPGTEGEAVPVLGAPGTPSRYQLPKAILTKKQRLDILEERFILGEITEETYKELKRKYEKEEDISDLESDEIELKGKLPGETEDIGPEENEDIEDIKQNDLSSEIEDLETMEHEEFEKTAEIPVEEPVIDDELQDIPEEVYPFPDDGFCITCGQSLDPDMAYCWSCGTKYETLEE